MSGKPASVGTVGASRAGVAGAPRVLLYVAEPRQLEPGATGPDLSGPVSHSPLDALYLSDNLQPQLALPPAPPYRAHLELPHPRNHSNTVLYKPLPDSETNLNICSEDNDITQREELYQASQHSVKETCLKTADRTVGPGSSGIKHNCAEQLGTDYCAVETFSASNPVESLDATYQRCSIAGDTDCRMPIVPQVSVHNGQNQFSESVTVRSGEIVNYNDRELSLGKSYMNYQFLEQSVSHQSIVNQSISILNQQVGVSGGTVSESDSGSAPQLVRTAEGVVLAVLPAPVISQPTDSVELSSRSLQGDSTQTIVVHLGWRRIVNGQSVLYISPSGTALSTLQQLREYLQTAGTCKCGLPCPLRPETAFSFDPKVASKPYEVASGAELTKLCNHKRKLLATLQARSHSPATPPPFIEQKKVAVSEVVPVKKKMKKRSGFPAGVNVPQLMVPRERSANEIKHQDAESKRNISQTNLSHRINNVHHCVPASAASQQSILSAGLNDNEMRQEAQTHRSSHYLTVNSGWISQHQENSESNLKTSQPLTGSVTTPLTVGMPVLGTNGQIIGLNTGFNKQMQFKNAAGVPLNVEPEQKDDKKDINVQQTVQSAKQKYKEEESQIFCGLNQPLTPEVMQKINEQQQIFIQQNQKQIEMAMKGFRTQSVDNLNNKQQSQNQYMTQAQLVIHNGAVVKTNPAKTPPWQLKRNDGSSTNSMTSPSPKLQKLENDYEEANTNISEDSSGSYSSFSSSDQNANQSMCTRVPPLPQHYTMLGQQWPVVDNNKKKVKSNKGSKKKCNPAENRLPSFGINGLRLVQDSKGNICEDIPNNNVPSFMEDPNGFLAQQTVILNNTISRQVGINSLYSNNQYDNSHNTNYYVTQSQTQMEKTKPVYKTNDLANIYRINVPNSPLSPSSNTPDSSVLSENAVSHCCKGCNVAMKSNSPEYSDNQMQIKYIKHMYKMEMDSHIATSSPKHSFEENPVTSTFIERNHTINDNPGPIQAGTVSTSNVSLTETLQPPEPSPTLSSSSRSTDTPHSGGSNNSQVQPNCVYPMPSPAYSNSGSGRENFGQGYPYNSPGPPHNQSLTGTQMMHFISNHNVNKNLMEVENISNMVGSKPGVKISQEIFKLEPRRRFENSMPGYCPPPHLGGGPAHSLIQACYVQTFVTTMASGFSVTRDTVTSVLAGKANTATTSINASQANFIRPPPPPSVNLATSYAIPNNQPDPFINSVNLPTSYPLHIAGTTAQNMISKSPLEMVQNVIGSLPSKVEINNAHTTSLPQLRRTCATTPGQILISSTGQIIVSNNQMPPPPPKMSTTTAPIQNSSNITNVSASVTQVIPAAGGTPSMVNQQTVVVNTLPAPFVIQPPMMAVDGQVVQQNTVLPQIMAGGLVSGQSPNETTRQLDVKNQHGFIQGVAMLSPETLKKRSKKKKNQPANITNLLQITAPQQNSNNIMVHHSSPQHISSPQFSPRGFQLSPNNNISPTPMLQALTIVPGKSGTPAHIVMNGQGNTNNYGPQQIITNTSPSQQINLLQPVNLINNASSVMQNFPTFQQFIVPNIGGMVMTADGTAIIQDNSPGMPMQLQLQAVNGQNVLTPVQNSGMFTTGANGGVVIRAQNQQGKMIQSQHSPGAQFLSSNSQVMMNSPNFNGQLSPLLANLSPTNVSFNAGAQVRTANVQAQEYIQTNHQAGQTLMVPLSPKRVSMASTANARGSNSTFVHQNTTIVQQQTTLVANSHNAHLSAIAPVGNQARLSVDSNTSIGARHRSRGHIEPVGEIARQFDIKEENGAPFSRAPAIDNEAKAESSEGYGRRRSDTSPGSVGVHARHSVSTQTLANQQRGKSPNSQVPGHSTPLAVSGSSPPDTTTHSPLGALETAGSSPRRAPSRPPDTTTESPEPTEADASSSAMVQCVSSSEPDIAESRELAWPTLRNEFTFDNDAQSMMSNIPLLRQNRPHNIVESTDIHYNQNMGSTSANSSQHALSISSNYYDRTPAYKRKNDFGDGSSYRLDKIMRTHSYSMVHGLPKEPEYNLMGVSSQDKSHPRHFPSGSSSDIPKLFDRHNLGSGDGGGTGARRQRKKPTAKSNITSIDRKSEMECSPGESGSERFKPGDVVWGPVKGYASWPGKLQSRGEDGRWTVRWFGAERPPGLLHDARLLALSEGLEAHHAARTKHRKSRKLNTLLENAIQEAMAELDKKSDDAAGTVEPTVDRTHEQNECDGIIIETPKRSKKHDKLRSKDKHLKRIPAKIAPRAGKSGETRLRKSR